MADEPKDKPVGATPPESKPATPPAAGGAPPAAAAPPKPAAPKPTPPPPKEGPVALDNEMTKRYRARFGEAIRETWIDRKQAIIVVAAEKWLEVAAYTRDEEKFNLLSDLTAVDWPKREKRFDVLCNLYSFEKNERVRLKTHVADGAPVASVAGIWPTANWLERECFDMFGIRFEGHPDLHRILLPEEWQGHPLRKDYDILTQDEKWVKENLGIDSGQ